MRLILLLLWLILSLPCIADTIIVHSITESVHTDNSESYPKDLNGDDCAILTLKTDLKGMQFNGNVIECNPSTDGYDLYLVGGTRKIAFYHSSILPTEIKFNDFGVKYLKPSRHYTLTCSIIKNKDSRIDLFDDTPEMVYARYNYADSIINSRVFAEMSEAVDEYFSSHPDYGNGLTWEQATEHLFDKFASRLYTHVHNSITAVKLGYAPALDEVRGAYSRSYTRPYMQQYIDELKQDWENKMSRMIFNYITGISTYNPLQKIMQESVVNASRMIEVPDIDELDITLPLNHNTIGFMEKVIEYNELAKKLQNYRIECKITEPYIKLYAKFLNRPYNVLLENDYRESSIHESKESYLRLKLMLLWQQIKDFGEMNKVQNRNIN